ncbi:MAG: PQQ-binding-like beta-propeller repeat protein [Alphaproteobacteria bacterium]|nr:PQQ-binding-like beta-propeller repeat protein [Alphaproteobacteria bacterium]
MSYIRIAAALTALCLASPAQAVTSSSAYQGNAAHDGRLSMSGGFLPPLHQIWSRDLGGAQNAYVGYPVVANGLAFVTVSNADDQVTRLYALDLQTGKTVWMKPMHGPFSWSTLAYDNGRLFVQNEDGVVKAFEANRKGKIAWVTRFGGTPAEIIAANGHVFISANLIVGSLSEKDGHVEWSRPVNGSASSPAADDVGVYVGYPCQYYEFDQATGDTLWHNSGNCSGGGDANPVYYDHQVFVRDWATHNWVLDANTGKKTGQIFPADQSFAIWPQPSGQPALIVTSRPSGETAFLKSIDLASGNVNWSFKPDVNDSLDAAPLVLNDMVVVGSNHGKLYLLDAATGAKLWSADVGAAMLSDGTGRGGNSERLRESFGAGDDVLLVPATNLLVAYKP